MDLDKLIPFLRLHAVRRFKDGDVEIYFYPPEIPERPAEPPAPLPTHIPPEIANPELMTQQQVMEWSVPGAGAPGEPLIEGTGDAPIDPPKAQP